MQKKVVDWLYNLQSRWGILKEEERSCMNMLIDCC